MDFPMAAISEEQPSANQGPAQTRGRGRPFLPGQSGNPAGRPKRLLSIEAEIRDLHGPKTLEVLDRLHRSAIGGSVAAAKVYLDRVLGPPRNPDPLQIAEHLRQVARERIEALFKALGKRLANMKPAEIAEILRQSACDGQEYLDAAEEYLSGRCAELAPPHAQPIQSGPGPGQAQRVP